MHAAASMKLTWQHEYVFISRAGGLIQYSSDQMEDNHIVFSILEYI